MWLYLPGTLEFRKVADELLWAISLLNIQLSIQKQEMGPYWTP